MSPPNVARRRWFGLLFLILAAGMLIWGQTVLQPLLRGWALVVYWVVCLAFTGLAMLTALLDVRATRLRIRNQHAELVRRALQDLPPEPKGPHPPKP